MKVIRLQNFVTVLLENGAILQASDFTDEKYKKLKECKNDDEVIAMFNLKVAEKKETQKFLNNVEESNILSLKGDCIYWESVSKLSLPQSLAERILKAEKEDNKELLQTYKNFWILMSLNPDPLCRKNLFKFLEKWGMVITKSGFFIGYRNVDRTSEDGVFTDHHSGKFKIKLKEMVHMKRELCDNDSNISCSRGLHIGGTSWLSQYYFGDVGIVCLVNPADVVAVPMDDEEYGKLRCCAYMPMQYCSFDYHGKVIPVYSEDGLDDSDVIQNILYDGILSDNDDMKYHIEIPEIPELNPVSITAQVLNIARTYIKS